MASFGSDDFISCPIKLLKIGMWLSAFRPRETVSSKTCSEQGAGYSRYTDRAEICARGSYMDLAENLEHLTIIQKGHIESGVPGWRAGILGDSFELLDI